MIPDRPRHQVLIGGRDVSERCDSIVYSATDNGGFEICTLGLPASDRPKKGAAIIIRSGLETAWAGRVAELADHSQHGRATKTTGGEGWRALMRDNPFSMIYVDRDLTRWSQASTTRQLASLTANNPAGSFQAAPDPTNGNPSLLTTITGAWAAPNIPIAEAWYDAGTGNLIVLVNSTLVQGAAVGPAAPWTEVLGLSTDDVASSTVFTSVSAGGAINVTGVGQRYAFIKHYYNATPGGVAAQDYMSAWENVAAYGNHGLTGRGATPQGFYPSDVARHALSQCKGIVPGRIDDAIGYIAPQVVYRTPVPPDQIVDDMAKLMGWPWGVWEPSGVFSDQPRLDFRAPPTDATAVVTKAECDQLDVTSRLGDLYNIAQITYSDQAGVTQMATVVLANPQLSEVGIPARTLSLNIGASSPAAAAAYGAFALALSQVSARAAGQATLPVSVRLPYGGSKPSHLLRPGIDRLRIVDLVDGGPLFDVGNVRRDVFRISRTETTVDKTGAPSTRVELDSGTNLLETLQAREALSAGVVGSGASGG